MRVHLQMGGALARSGKAMTLKASPRAAAAKSAGPMMAAGGFVPDMGRRQLMNAFLLGSIAGPLLVLPAVLISYLTPAKAGGGGGGTVAKDALGNDVKEADWLKANGPGARKLVQGLKVSTESQAALAAHLRHLRAARCSADWGSRGQYSMRSREEGNGTMTVEVLSLLVVSSARSLKI